MNRKFEKRLIKNVQLITFERCNIESLLRILIYCQTNTPDELKDWDTTVLTRIIMYRINYMKILANNLNEMLKI